MSGVNTETRKFRAALRKSGFTVGRAKRYCVVTTPSGFDVYARTGAHAIVVASARHEEGLDALGRTVLSLHFNPKIAAVVDERHTVDSVGFPAQRLTCNKNGSPCSFPRCMPCDEVRGGLVPVADAPARPAPTVKVSSARLFVLDRAVDATGTSGTGVVAEGVRFSNGKVALHWLSHFGAVNVYDSMEVCEQLHGHGGNTKVVWKDEVK